MQNDFRPSGASVKPAPALKQTPTTASTPEPAEPFQTPEQASQQDEAVASPLLTTTPPTETATPRGTGHHWFNLPWPPTKHEIVLATVVLAVALLGGGAFALMNKSEAAPAQPVVAAKKVVVPPKPTTVPAALSGLAVEPTVNQRPVVGVMIENSQTARPQSGLSDAGVIFEAIAEGGITRFLALYQDKQPTNIGPVRSARPYYVQWNEGFRAAYAHVGGSADALADIKAWDVQDLNQFYNAGVFRRDGSRAAPHNVYSNVGELAALATQKGYSSQFTSFLRKTATPLATPSAGNIDFAISSALYNSNFTYDKASDSYLRSEGGAAQLDANTGKQLAPNVVIGMVVPLSAGGKTAQGGAYSNYNPIESGAAYIFQDGGVTIGTWTKTTNTSQITFADQAGAQVKLNPGQTWLTALSSSTKISYR